VAGDWHTREDEDEEATMGIKMPVFMSKVLTALTPMNRSKEK
jgi:hypothetical protein